MGDPTSPFANKNGHDWSRDQSSIRRGSGLCITMDGSDGAYPYAAGLKITLECRTR